MPTDQKPSWTEFDLTTMSELKAHRLLTGLVIPRPIAWVGTVDHNGNTNLAPHSYFTVASTEPAIVQFTSLGRKDTLRNVEATGDFTVNLVSRAQAPKMNATADALPSGESEFGHAGLEEGVSRQVRAPRVVGSPAVMECRLHDVIPVGNSFLVLGTVLTAYVDSAAVEGSRPVERILDPVGRLSGSRYVTFGDILSIRRTG